MKIRDYSDFTIDYNTATRRFEAYKADGKVTLWADTENQLVTKIDAATKRQEKAKKSGVFPVAIIYKNYNDLYVGKITSIADDGDIWITYDKNGTAEREKKSARYASYDFFKPTESNLSRLEQYKIKQAAITKLQNDMSAIRQSLTDRIDIEGIVRKLNE